MSTPPGQVIQPQARLRAEVLVIGSGPGGAITACLLAEAGRDVLLVEEGSFLPLESCPPFSVAEMEQKYRNGGLTPAFGGVKVAYVEGRCVGGGSEINSGLYHRTPPDVLGRWQKEFQLQAATEADLLPHFEACERDVNVSLLDGPPPPASLKLHEGATRLGWKSLEIPRWYKSSPGGPGVRQSMTRTFMPRFLAAGGRLLPQTRVQRLHRDGATWQATAATGVETVTIDAETVFSCGGAIQTPTLLRRSGITANIGNSLQLHPTVKVTARFDEVVNHPGMGVPVHQVKEFAPQLSFGCSISSQPYLALAMTDHPAQFTEVNSAWQNMAIYYAMITTGTTGTVRTLPGFRDAFVRYQLTQADLACLADGIRKLGRLLFTAGARTLYPSVKGLPPLQREADLAQVPDNLPAPQVNAMTIHLFSSCPMGENHARCATDSFGKVHGQAGLHISDASLLCTAPGVNPQGSVMGFARRNALKFLGKL